MNNSDDHKSTFLINIYDVLPVRIRQAAAEISNELIFGFWVPSGVSNDVSPFFKNLSRFGENRGRFSEKNLRSESEKVSFLKLLPFFLLKRLGSINMGYRTTFYALSDGTLSF